MTQVSQRTVLEQWLELERRKSGAESAAVESLTERELLDRLLNEKPGAAAFIWRDAPIEWRRVTLSRSAFEQLRVVAGPDDLSWRALSPDETILGGARRIVAESPDDLTAETGVDVQKVSSLRSNPPDEPLVLIRRWECKPPRVADGNYRATARAVNLVKDGTYDPVSAYLGVASQPPLEPLQDRVCGAVRGLLGRRTW